PKTAIFAHIDSIGFMIRNDKELIRIGMPRAKTGYILTGRDSDGYLECDLKVDNRKKLSYYYNRPIERGTDLTFKAYFREKKNHIQCCYLDNRLGVWNALQVAKSLKHGILVFSCWEEHGGGSVGYLAKFIFEQYGVNQALISDITWVTKDVRPGNGVAISIRDSGIPRRSYVEKIIATAKKNKIPFQLEIEASGGSDGNYLQAAPYPIDWCFIGAPEDNVHTPDEKVHKDDIEAMVDLYKVLMEEL
ncbi:M20/M25/M40 family metallo-hydrolase, partial [Candidatus Amoebophilus asiaticus]|nr:M20/M25/M40 family metallo-hydrolase [Candidatus Amoebophilus asiaticus]